MLEEFIGDSVAIFGSMLLPRAGAGMCARRRSNFLLVAKRKSPKRRRPRCPCPLRGNLRCSLQAGSAQTRLRLKQRAALFRLKLRFSARTEGESGAQHPFGPSLRSATGLGTNAAQALGSDYDFAQRNSCSDPNPGTSGTAWVGTLEYCSPAAESRAHQAKTKTAPPDTAAPTPPAPSAPQRRPLSNGCARSSRALREPGSCPAVCLGLFAVPGARCAAWR